MHPGRQFLPTKAPFVDFTGGPPNFCFLSSSKPLYTTANLTFEGVAPIKEVWRCYMQCCLPWHLLVSTRTETAFDCEVQLSHPARMHRLSEPLARSAKAQATSRMLVPTGKKTPHAILSQPSLAS
ncbi:hypothetical protein LIA77_01351 [Sarocladium implicatum]|nr:hypothetical protein LIA77_01351 [Sarocladium implicatum]